MALPKVVELVQTCPTCPMQWDGTLADGRKLYIRYRWGLLTYSIWPSTGRDPCSNPEFAEYALYGGPSSEWITDRELVALTDGELDWSVIVSAGS